MALGVRTSYTSNPFSGSIGQMNRVGQGAPTSSGRNPSPPTPSSTPFETLVDAYQQPNRSGVYVDPNTFKSYNYAQPFAVQPPTPPTPYQQAAAYYTAQAAPQLLQLSSSDAALQLQQQAIQSQGALQNRYLNQDLNFGNRGLDLQQAALGVDQSAANRQLGYLSQLMGMNTADLNRRLGFVDQNQTLAQQSSDRQLGFVDQQRGFETESHRLDLGNIAEQYEREMRSQRDDAAARGAGTSTGHRSAVEDISQDLLFRTATRNLQNRAAQAGLTDQEFGIRETLARQLLGFNEQRGELNSQYARDQLGLNNQKDMTRDQLKTLDIRAQEIGLSREQLKSNIQRQLEKSNLDMFFGVQDVINALQSNDIQREQMADQIIRQAVSTQQFFGG